MKRKPKTVDKKLDEAWSKLVKLRDKKCMYCGKTDYLNAHHIYSRSKRSVRWDIDNGIALCVAHHVFSSTFSAHKTPLEFIKWLEKFKGSDFIDKLTLKANKTFKPHKHEKEDMLFELNKKINEIQNI